MFARRSRDIARLARYELDMTGLIARSRHFAPLTDVETFARAAVVEDGLGVAWPVETKWGRLDISASTLRLWRPAFWRSRLAVPTRAKRYLGI